MTKYPAIIVALLIVVLSGCTGESSEHGGPYIIESVGSDQANEYQSCLRHTQSSSSTVVDTTISQYRYMERMMCSLLGLVVLK